MAELGSNGFDPSHLRIVPSSSGSGPNDKRDVTESPLLSFVTWEWEKRKTSGGEYRIYASRFPHVIPVASSKECSSILSPSLTHSPVPA